MTYPDFERDKAVIVLTLCGYDRTEISLMMPVEPDEVDAILAENGSRGPNGWAASTGSRVYFDIPDTIPLVAQPIHASHARRVTRELLDTLRDA